MLINLASFRIIYILMKCILVLAFFFDVFIGFLRNLYKFARENQRCLILNLEQMAKVSENKELISKEVVESYIFSTVRHDFGIYSERLLLRLVELAQCEINGLDFKGGTDIGKVSVGAWGHTEITIPVKDILSGEDDTNYTKAKQSVRQLMGKFLEYEDDNTYKATQILNEVDVDKISGKMVIQVNRNVWNAMLDFSKGFRKYELETATRLRGKYSLRIYKLVSKQTQPITYLIEDLRKMWGLTDKYKKVDDFVKNTIVAAKEELDRVSPYSFDYILNAAKTAEVNKGRKGRPAITSVTFFPIHRLNNESTDAVRKSVDPSLMLDRSVSSLLRDKFGFDWSGIKANISLFDIAQKQFDVFDFLQQIAPKALRAVNPQGYVVNAVKKHLKENFGVIIESGIILQDNKIAKKAVSAKKEPTSLKDIFGGVDEQ